jgi:hypothetical protein
MTWHVILWLVAGFVLGSVTFTLALSKERKTVAKSRRDLANEWINFWKRKAELDKREMELLEQSGSFPRGAS